MPGEQRAVLLTRALDGWQELGDYLACWSQLAVAQQQAILHACGELARRLHGAGQLHGCFYPKHIFLQAQGEHFAACLIDLEKTRPLLLGRRDRIKDLEPLLRRASRQWGGDEWRVLLQAYLDDPLSMPQWLTYLRARLTDKEGR